jgi:rRNA maturation protein Nop10
MAHEVQIVVRCPECGDRRVSPEAVTVRSCVDNGAWTYRFTCSGCGLPTVGESTLPPLLEAVEAGAGLEAWELPTHLDRRPQGAPFTLADVLELHLLLLEPNWFEELRGCDHDFER